MYVDIVSWQIHICLFIAGSLLSSGVELRLRGGEEWGGTGGERGGWSEGGLLTVEHIQGRAGRSCLGMVLSCGLGSQNTYMYILCVNTMHAHTRGYMICTVWA